MRIASNFKAAVLLVLLSGCDAALSPPRAPVPEDYVVTSVLRVGQAEQGVLVTGISDPAQTAVPYRLDAIVSLNGTDVPALAPESLRATLDGPSSLLRDVSHRTRNLQVEGGEDYILRVVVDGVVIEGQTRVPESFQGFVRDRRIWWTRSANAASYRVTATPEDEAASQSVQYEAMTADTLIVLPGGDRALEGAYWVRIEALDANLDGIVRGSDEAGLVTGRGTFGAMAFDEGRVFFSAESLKKTALNPASRAVSRKKG